MSAVSYYAYNSDGEIVATGICDESAVAGDHLPPGATVVIGSADPANHYVAGGQLHAYTVSQRDAKSNRPSLWVRWSNATMSWVDLRTLDALRASKWAEVKALRDAAIVTPKATPHGTFDAKPEDQNNLSKVIDLVRLAASRGAPAEGNYTLATNERVTLTLTELEDAALAIGAQVQALFDAADTLRQQIEAATTPAEVEAITWTST